ncbi:hypothetical protein ACIBQ2_04150 [Micromonospora sediminimaris]|uniref:hypothetical protein n=1 Tax=Micromonospora sediminimaris TaxID=547162 RepID=UPI00379E9116
MSRPRPTAPRVAAHPAGAAPAAQRTAGSPAASRPHSRSAEPLARLPEVVRDEVAAVVAEAGTLAAPLIAALVELLDAELPLLDSVVVGLEPVLDVLDPVVELPQPAPAPVDPTPRPDPDPATPPAPAAEPALPARPDRADAGADSARQIGSVHHVIRHRSGHPAASLPHSGEEIVDGGLHERDGQADRTPGPPPSSPAPGTSGAESAPTSHSGPVGMAVAGWSPPAVNGRVTRLARTRRRPSRSPRPRSRPA